MKQELHDNNSNVNVQVDKNPTFKGCSEIPVAWTNGKGKFVHPDVKDFDERTGGIRSFDCDIPLYTSPQYRELSVEEIHQVGKEVNKKLAKQGHGIIWFDNGLITFAKAILERAKK